MRAVSSLYTTLRGQTDSLYEVQIVRGQRVYDMTEIKNAVVHQSLLNVQNGPAIGGTTSAQCRITLYESSANWPRMASFEIKVRLCSADGQTTSEWLSFGTFWTDSRSEGKYGTLTIEGYDAMLQLNQYWTNLIPTADMPASWPITAAAAAALLEETTGIEMDSRDTLDNTVAFIGLDTLRTAREVWADIAAAHGCNAVLTPEGKIHLIPLVNEIDDSDSAVAGIAIAGIAVVGSTGGGGSGESPGQLVLGLAVSKLDTSPALAAVSGVILEDCAGHPASAGADTGYILKATCEYSDSAAAALCLSKVSGYVYRPFDARDAHLDPAAELGDLVLVDGVNYQIMTIDWDLGAWIMADLSAPVEIAIDHEYTVMSPAAATLRKAMELDAALNTSLRSYIQQTATEITTGVAATYVSNQTLATTVAHLQEEIDGAVETYSGSAVPTLQNAPASSWTTDAIKDTHVGDLYIVNSQGGDYAGFYYRFEKLGTGSYQWTLLKDTEITKALADAAEANELATEAQEEASRIESILENDYSPTADIEARFYSQEEGEEAAAALQSEISLTESRLTIAMSALEADVEGQFETMAYYIRYQNGVVIIGRTDQPLNLRLSPDTIAMCYNSDPTSYWDQNKQLTPKALEIPVGGSLRLGSVQWQPRSSGNLSLLWVGSEEEED